MKKQILFFIVTFLCPVLLTAQTNDSLKTASGSPNKGDVKIKNPIKAPGGFSIYGEEDSFNSKWNKDRNYTGGFALTFTGPRTGSPWLVVPFARRNIDCFLHLEKAFTKVQGEDPYLKCSSFAIGTSVFTPFDLGKAAVIHGDRPYASLVFASSRLTRVWQDAAVGEDELALSTELTIGALGLPVGDSMQTWIHRYKINKNPTDTSNRVIPLGWANQISNGGEMTALYRIDVQSRLGTFYWKRKFWEPKAGRLDHTYKILELGAETGLNIGYYTNVSAGLSMKLGLFNCSFWQNRTNFGSSSQQIVGSSEVDRREDVFRNFEIYLVGSTRARLVGYNALLQGQTRSTAYRMKPDEITRMVYEFEYGVALRLWWVNIIYEPYAGRTSELNTLYARKHIWGAIQISINAPIGG